MYRSKRIFAQSVRRYLSRSVKDVQILTGRPLIGELTTSGANTRDDERPDHDGPFIGTRNKGVVRNGCI
jgi:hypothetical protein